MRFVIGFALAVASCKSDQVLDRIEPPEATVEDPNALCGAYPRCDKRKAYSEPELERCLGSDFRLVIVEEYGVSVLGCANGMCELDLAAGEHNTLITGWVNTCDCPVEMADEARPSWFVCCRPPEPEWMDPEDSWAVAGAELLERLAMCGLDDFDYDDVLDNCGIAHDPPAECTTDRGTPG